MLSTFTGYGGYSLLVLDRHRTCIMLIDGGKYSKAKIDDTAIRELLEFCKGRERGHVFSLL